MTSAVDSNAAVLFTLVTPAPMSIAPATCSGGLMIESPSVE